LVCAHIHSTAELHGVKQILFSSRYCYMLAKIYRLFSKSLNWQEQNCYFYTSRESRLKSSDSYLSYFESLNTEKSMVVDLCGTGWSLGQLYSRSTCKPLTYFVHYMNNNSLNDTYGKIRPFQKNEKPFFLINDSTLNNIIFELINYTSSGMFLDMKKLEGYDAFIPEFEYPNYPSAVNNVLKQIEQTQDQFLETLKNYDLLSMMGEINNNFSKISTIFLELYQYTYQNIHCMLDVADYHISQDNKSILRLKNM